MDTRRSAFTQTISILERYCNVTLTFINDTWQRSVNALKNKAPQAPSPRPSECKTRYSQDICTGLHRKCLSPGRLVVAACAVNEPKTSCGDCRDEHSGHI